MKKHLKRLLSMMMAVLLCFGIFPSSAFAKEYEYDGYISMIDHKSRGYSLSSIFRPRSAGTAPISSPNCGSTT